MAESSDLTPSESALLIVLMSEARPISNTELKERFKLTLTGEGRRRLNDMKFVESQMEGRTYVHQLGEKGWARCHRELNFESPRARALGAALTSMLGGVHRYLESKGHSLADVFAPTVVLKTEPASNVDLTTRIRDAYRVLADKPGAWVGFVELRERLADVSRPDLDEALRQLERVADVNIVPQSNQKALSEADRTAALRIGGQDKHFLAIGV